MRKLQKRIGNKNVTDIKNVKNVKNVKPSKTCEKEGKCGQIENIENEDVTKKVEVLTTKKSKTSKLSIKGNARNVERTYTSQKSKKLVCLSKVVNAGKVNTCRKLRKEYIKRNKCKNIKKLKTVQNFKK